MADALCGPSNALQSFKNHAQVDRSLQQDRLTGARHPAAQGFRTPDLRAGSLDGEFAAFEAGSQQPFHLQQQPLVTLQSFGSAHSFPQLPQQNVQPAPGWVADFQQVHLGAAQNWSTPQNQFQSEASGLRSNLGRAGGGWQHEFGRQHQQYHTSHVNGKQAVRPQVTQPSYLQSQPVSQYSFRQQQSGLYPGLDQQPELYQGTHQALGADVHPHAQMDVAHIAAFEAAFAQAEATPTSQHQESHRNLTPSGEVAGVRLDPILTPQTPVLSTLQPILDPRSKIFIGSDAIPYHPANTALTPAQSADKYTRGSDELARTAGQLLSSVEHETSAKFQQSQFLTLMRRLRDREVEMRGGEFREVGDAGKDGAKEEAPGVGVDTTGGSGVSALDSYRKELRMLEEQRKRMSEKEPRWISGQRGVEGEDFTVVEGSTEDSQALHPGGRGYPGTEGLESTSSEVVGADREGGGTNVEEGPEDRHKYDHWASGGIGIEDERIEESQGLAARFSRASLQG